MVFYSAAAAAKSLQSCLTLCDPTDGSPPALASLGFSRQVLEWVAISFSNAWKWKVKAQSLSRVWLLMTPWTAAHQAPPSIGFSRQQYWSGLPLPSSIEVKYLFVLTHKMNQVACNEQWPSKHDYHQYKNKLHSVLS